MIWLNLFAAVICFFAASLPPFTAINAMCLVFAILNTLIVAVHSVKEKE